MKKIFSKKSFLATLLICLSLLFSLPALAAQAGKSYNFVNQSGLNTAATEAGYDTGATSTSLNTIISTVIRVILSFVGVLLFILLIYGAFTWMTAEGNEEKVKKAKGIVVNSIIGLVITLSAYAISYFLIGYFWSN